MKTQKQNSEKTSMVGLSKLEEKNGSTFVGMLPFIFKLD